MQKKDSSAAFIFVVFCLGGVLSLFSQRGTEEGAAAPVRQGSLNLPARSVAVPEGELIEPLLEGSRLLETEPGRKAETIRCSKRAPLE